MIINTQTELKEILEDLDTEAMEIGRNMIYHKTKAITITDKDASVRYYNTTYNRTNQ